MNDFGYEARRAPVVDRFDADAAALDVLLADGDAAPAPGTAAGDAGERLRHIRAPGRAKASGPRAGRAARAVAVRPGRRASSGLPCQAHDPDLWFADAPSDVERAKALCEGCPVRLACLAGAIDRREPTGVWGGQILDQGRVVTHKRSRGRPPKGSVAPQSYPALASVGSLASLSGSAGSAGSADEALRSHVARHGWLPGSRSAHHQRLSISRPTRSR